MLLALLLAAAKLPEAHLAIAIAIAAGAGTAYGHSMNAESGFFGAASACFFPFTYPSDDGRQTLHGDRYSLTLTGGYRFFVGRYFFGELAVGGGAAKGEDPGPTSYLGTIGPARNAVEFQPDGALALGVRF